MKGLDVTLAVTEEQKSYVETYSFVRSLIYDNQSFLHLIMFVLNTCQQETHFISGSNYIFQNKKVKFFQKQKRMSASTSHYF